LEEILISLNLTNFFLCETQISHIVCTGFIYQSGYMHVQNSSEYRAIKQGYTLTYSIIQARNWFWDSQLFSALHQVIQLKQEKYELQRKWTLF